MLSSLSTLIPGGRPDLVGEALVVMLIVAVMAAVFYTFLGKRD